MTDSLQADLRLLPKPRFDDLIGLLIRDGYEVVGPRLEQGAIIYAQVRSAQDLPIGWTDRQAAGSYRLERRDDEAYFGYAVGPHSWKKYLFPPVLQLWQAQRTASGFTFHEEEDDPPRRAFLGMRACELHALAVQDRVFINREKQFTDPHYAKAREGLFLIAVECEHPGGTCFCASMGTGPAVQPERVPLLASKNEDVSKQAAAEGVAKTSLPILNQVDIEQRGAPSVCDLVLTELDDAFVIRAVSPEGQGVVDRLGLAPASAEQAEDGHRRVEAAAQSMGRALDVTDLRNLLHRNQEHPRWDDVADRCLACTNCTLVCPTCFCSCTEDVTDLTLQTAERVRRWDSCFSPEFGQVHGGNFRPSIRGRYRQWLTHKFASWFDQFDVSGCVGCGRCITWCPVGIDVTEEIAAIRASDGKRVEKEP
jgi:ferredoxin